MSSYDAVSLARTTRTDGRPVFEPDISLPDNPSERAALGVSALRGIDKKFGDIAEATYGSRAIGTLYHAISANGVTAVAGRMGTVSGLESDTLTPSVATVKALVDQAGYYDVLCGPTNVSIYLTEAGGLLTDPQGTATPTTAQRVINVHELAKELARAGLAQQDDPLAKLHAHTRRHLLENLRNLVETVQQDEAVPVVVHEGAREPKLPIPDHKAGDNAVVDAIRIGGDGVVKDISVSVDITHPYSGDLDIYLVAPDGTEAHLKKHKPGSGTPDVKTTYTVNDAGLACLQGRPVSGDWKLRVADAYRGDTGTLNAWSLSVHECGASGDTRALSHPEQKAFFAGVGGLLQRLLVIGTDPSKYDAMKTLVGLVKDCPFFDVRLLLAAGVQQRYAQLTPECKEVFDTRIKPLVAPASPDYDAIYRVVVGADGTPVANKRTLNCAMYFGSEKDDAIYRGGLQLLKDGGFVETPSDKPGFLLLTKPTKQAHCDEIRLYAKHMNGRNMLELMADKDIDVIMYDGHSNLGRNLENCVMAAPAQKGSKVVVVGACATTDRVFTMRHKYPDPIRTQLVNTYESSYFRTSTDDGRQIMTSSENNDLVIGLMTAMAARNSWQQIEKILERSTSSWAHTVAVNYTNPSKLGELLALIDMDRDGIPDYGDPVYDGDRVVVPQQVRQEFEAQQPPAPVDELDATRVFSTVQSLDTMGRYNFLVKKLYAVRTLVSDGFVDLGQEGPIVRVHKDTADKRWHVAVNSWYSHASVEALRACAHYELGLAAVKESDKLTKPTDRKLYALLFAAASLKYDSGYADERIWAGLLQRYRLPPELSLRDFFEVLRVEYEERHGDLSGGVRNVADIKKHVTDDAVLASLEQPDVGTWA